MTHPIATPLGQLSKMKIRKNSRRCYQCRRRRSSSALSNETSADNSSVSIRHDTTYIKMHNVRQEAQLSQRDRAKPRVAVNDGRARFRQRSIYADNTCDDRRAMAKPAPQNSDNHFGPFNGFDRRPACNRRDKTPGHIH